MADKTFTNMANPLFFNNPTVNGLFRWTDASGAVKNTPVRLKGTDGPPIDVGAMTGAGQAAIGVVLEGGEVTNDIVVVLTKYTAVVSLTCGAACTRGSKVKTDASGEIEDAVLADVGTGATGATEGRIIGQALQSGVATDIIYIGLTS